MTKTKIEPSDATGRKAWARPSVTPLRAGAAEAIPGSQVFDGSLETIGS